MEATNISNRASIISTALNNSSSRTTTSEVEARRDSLLKEFSGLKNNTKEDTQNIKNINETFGALKKSEKTLDKLVTAIESGDFSGAKELLNTTYKEEKILFTIPIGKETLDLGTSIESALNSENADEALSVIAEGKTTVTETLADVKKEMLSQTSALGATAQKSVDNSGISLDLSSISKSSNMDYLKQQMKSLLE